ncbi:MAG: HAD hydrolase-like protein [Lachnospiraceae bacterium]|nr:HAD hydrolase-like protein [Lachnospiraceae bacterium]
MKYKLVIFDFDGTIADTAEGILDSHRYTLAAMERNVPSENVLRGVIGAALLEIYKKQFGFSENQAKRAVNIYRERYAESGIHKACLYPGIKDTLSELKRQRYKIGIATLKAERFASYMLNKMGIFEYFDVICGMDDSDEYTKARLLRKCCALCGVDECEAVLVGDSDSDLNGSIEAKVDFIGVTYGFGFNPDSDYDFCTIHNAPELISCLEYNGSTNH